MGATVFGFPIAVGAFEPPECSPQPETQRPLPPRCSQLRRQPFSPSYYLRWRFIRRPAPRMISIRWPGNLGRRWGLFPHADTQAHRGGGRAHNQFPLLPDKRHDRRPGDSHPFGGKFNHQTRNAPAAGPAGTIRSDDYRGGYHWRMHGTVLRPVLDSERTEQRIRFYSSGRRAWNL